MPTAVVLGSNGQDGSYLSEVLLASGLDVVGAARQAESRWVNGHPRFSHACLDVADARALAELLRATRPDQIYALAAIHGSAGHPYEPIWGSALDVNVGSIHTCLEYIRLTSPETKLFFPSSLKVFGSHPLGSLSESTPRVSECLYSVTKNAAHDLIGYYRSSHGVWASVAYLFNHDSPRRPESYFLPRLVGRLAAHFLGRPLGPPLNSLAFWCDWGSSLEFMQLAARLVSLDQPHDVVIAAGRPIYAADLVAELSRAAGVPPEHWAEAVEPSAPRAGAPPFEADIGKLSRLVGRPSSDGLDVALWILKERYGVALAKPATPAAPKPARSNS